MKIGRPLVNGCCLAALCAQWPSHAQQLPAGAIDYMPLLKQNVAALWPEAKPRSPFAAQIEQETCISLKSKGCWNPKTELKTQREYGFGLGQLTVAYNADGSERFNGYTEMVKYRELQDWRWEDRYNPDYQLKALVLKDRNVYQGVKFPVADDFERLAFMFASYNGGLGGLLKDHKLCESTTGCNSRFWFNRDGENGVESTSYKSKTAAPGYKKSFFEISREYPKNIMYVRRAKYVSAMDD